MNLIFSVADLFFSSWLIFVNFDVKYFCIEAKIEIKFLSPPPAWCGKKTCPIFFITLFKDKCFLMISRGRKITLFLFLESKFCFPYLHSLFWKLGLGRGSTFVFICGPTPENMTSIALIAEIYVHSYILLLIHIEHFSIYK